MHAPKHQQNTGVHPKCNNNAYRERETHRHKTQTYLVKGVLQCVAAWQSVLQHGKVCCSMAKCAGVWCDVLHVGLPKTYLVAIEAVGAGVTTCCKHHLHIYIHKHTHTHTHTHTHSHVLLTACGKPHLRIIICVDVYIYVFMYIYICIYVQICIYRYRYPCIY